MRRTAHFAAFSALATPALVLVLAIAPFAVRIDAAEGPGAAAGPEALPRFLHEEYRRLEASRPPPPGAAEFAPRRAALRERHARALGIPLEHREAPVPWRLAGTIDRGDHEIRKIVFESRPGLPVPAHLYLPKERPGRLPAVLCVHGHWAEAKAAPAVQLRSAFLAKRGYAVLALDAIGAGERAWQDPVKGRIGYHGRQLGYALLPSGLTLAGLQVEDNRRAIDLLRSLPEVDPERIGCTGASGGGNQTFHIAVMDERIRAAAGVCFFGAYRGYLEGAHCSCELVPGVLRYAEEGDLAGAVAPRPLLIIAAIRDGGAAFRIDDARRSIAVAEKWYEAAGAAGRCRMAEFDCGHDYNREMRETMVAFFERHLKGIEVGDRVPEPPIDALPVDALACFGPEGPGKDSLTVPAIGAARGAEAAAAAVAMAASGPAGREELRRLLREEILGGFPSMAALPYEAAGPARSEGGLRIEAGSIRPEPGIAVGLELIRPEGAGGAPARAVIVLDGIGGAPSLPERPEVPADAVLVRARVRGTGPTAWPAAAAVDCPDYVLAQGSAVLGRPILGMWVLDALGAAGHVRGRWPGIALGFYGEGAMATVAVLAAALGDAGAAGTIDGLERYSFPGRFDDRWPLGLFAPGILRAGDLPAIAAGLVAGPVIAGRRRTGGSIAADDRGPAEVLADLLAALSRRAGPAGGALWRIEPLHTGICTMGKNHLLGDPFTDDERVPFSLISFLLEGPGGVLAIVDFGPKDPAYFNECFRRYGLFRESGGGRQNPDDVVQPEGNTLDHLKRLGISPGRVKHIVLTHLHYDHVGGSRPPDPGLLRDFPGAMLHISRRGWDDNLARRADGWRWTSYVDFDVSQEIFRRIEDGRGRAADDEEILPGLRTRYLGGHSVCSQAVLADTADGTAVIAGDVVYRSEYLEEGVVARLRTTPEEYIEAVDRTVRLVEETGGVLLPVHDPRILEAFGTRGEGWLEGLRPPSDAAVAAHRARGGAMRVLEKHVNRG